MWYFCSGVSSLGLVYRLCKSPTHWRIPSVVLVIGQAHSAQGCPSWLPSAGLLPVPVSGNSPRALAQHHWQQLPSLAYASVQISHCRVVYTLNIVIFQLVPWPPRRHCGEDVGAWPGTYTSLVQVSSNPPRPGLLAWRHVGSN